MTELTGPLPLVQPIQYEVVNFADLHPAESDLVLAACQQVNDCPPHAPYSHFPVGAAVRTIGGDIYTGVNVENASYGGTICAERTAILTAIANTSMTVREIVAVAVICVKTAFTKEGHLGLPCGMCRQVLSEFRPADKDMLVLVVWEAEDAGEERPVWPTKVARFTLGQIFPLDFGPRALKIKPDAS